jgi:GNAT superfamily N-acetyltransferase
MGQIRIKFQSVKRSLKYAGFLRALQRAFQRLVPNHVFDINGVVFIHADLSEVLDECKDLPINPDLRHRWSTAEDLDLLTCGGMTSDEVQQCFDAGGRAAITTTLDGEMVGYYWALPRYWDIYGWIRYQIEPQEYWGGHVFTSPAFRGQRMMQQIRLFAYGRLMSEGYVRVAGAVQSLNRSSLRVWSSPADRVAGRIFYVRMGSYVVYRMGRKWGAGFYAGSHPFEISTTTLEALEDETDTRR